MKTFKQTFAQWIAAFQSRVSPETFARRMLWIAGVWFLGIYPAVQWFCPFLLSREMNGGMNPPGYRAHLPVDFFQYYMGALAARHRMWGDLYPKANPDYYSAPPAFRPVFQTFLFDEKKMLAQKETFYYKGIHCPAENETISTVSEKLLAFCPELQKTGHYCQPPPFAVLLMPLGYFKAGTAALIWATLNIWALFGLAWFSSRIHRLLAGKSTWTEGFILLILVLFSIRSRTCVGMGNMTPMLGFLVAWLIHSWMKNRQGMIGLALIPLIVSKSMGLNWCLLLLLRRAQWKTLGIMALLTLLLNGATLWLAGTDVYRAYFFDLLPKIVVPIGTSFVGTFFMLFGSFPQKVYFVLTVLFSLLMYIGYYQKIKSANPLEQKLTIAAALGGAMLVFCYFNFSAWEVYFSMYYFFPLLGWLFWEAGQAQGKWRIWLAGAIVLSLVLYLTEWFTVGALFYLVGPDGVAWYWNIIYRPLVLLLPIVFYALSIRRLYFSPAPADTL